MNQTNGGQSHPLHAQSRERYQAQPSTPVNHLPGPQYLASQHKNLTLPPMSPTTAFPRIPPSPDTAGMRIAPVFGARDGTHSNPHQRHPSYNNIGTRPTDQTTSTREHLQFSRGPSIPNRSVTNQHSQHPLPPTAHSHSVLPPIQSAIPIRSSSEIPMSPHDRTSAQNLPPPLRRQSDVIQSPVQEKASTSSQPAFDPIILAATDAALGPVRSALETVWTLTLTNMRLAMNKMNTDFTNIATQERQKNAALASQSSQVENQLQSACQEVRTLRKENGDLREKVLLLQDHVQGYKEENRKLREEKERLEVERRVLAGMGDHRSSEENGGRDVAHVDMDKVLGAVTDQVSKHMERKMSELMNEFEAQRNLRSMAEQRLEHALHRINHSPAQSGSVTPARQSPAQERFTSSPQINERSPSLKRVSESSHSSDSTRVETPLIARTRSLTDNDPHPDGDAVRIVNSGPQSSSPRSRILTPPPKGWPFVASPVEMHRALPIRSASPAVPNPRQRSRTPSFAEASQPPRKRTRTAYEEEHIHSPRSAAHDAYPFPSGPVKMVQEPVESSGQHRSVPMQIGRMHEDDKGRRGSPARTPSFPTPTPVEVKPEPIEEGEVANDSGDSRPLTQAPVPEKQEPEAPRYNYQETGRPTSPRPPAGQRIGPPSQRNPKQLGISHLDLLYKSDTKGEMTCWSCLMRKRDGARDAKSAKLIVVKKFSSASTWTELIGHYQSEHPKTCRDLERMTPSQVAEMKQRMVAGDRSMHRG